MLLFVLLFIVVLPCYLLDLMYILDFSSPSILCHIIFHNIKCIRCLSTPFHKTSEPPSWSSLSSWSNLDCLFSKLAIRLSFWNFLHYYLRNFLNLFLVRDRFLYFVFLSWFIPLFQWSTFSNSFLRKGTWESFVCFENCTSENVFILVS